MKLFDLLQAVMDDKVFETEWYIAPYWRPTNTSYALELASNAVKDADSSEVTDRNIDIEFIRIRKDTIRVNGIDVPAPMTTEPKVGQVVYVPDYTSESGYFSCNWIGSTFQQRALARGMVYTNAEDATIRANMMFNM